MELFTVNGDFEGENTVDGYSSLIWTERFQGYGDFQLVMTESEFISINKNNPSFIMSTDSDSIMMIETISKPQLGSGKAQVTITGRSIEAFFTLRDTKQYGEKTYDKFYLDSYGYILERLVEKYCIDAATADTSAVIPGLYLGAAASTAPETVYVDRGNLYDSLVSVAKLGTIGFKILRGRTSGIFFTSYYGNDRTDVNAANFRMYSTEIDTLTNPSTLDSNAEFKNHAKVYGAKTWTNAYLPGTATSVSGFGRRTMQIDATDIGDDDSTTVTEDKEALKIRGIQIMQEAANSYKSLVDGDVPVDNWLENSFSVGDLVRVKAGNGAAVTKRISERITTVSNGVKRRVPTFEDP